MPLNFIISFQHIFHSNQHKHNYLSEWNSHVVLRTHRTCEVFNIAGKYKPQLQCITSDTMYMDIKSDLWQVIQQGYKTISWLLTHTAKELVHRHYDQQWWHIQSKVKTSSSTLLCVNCSWHTSDITNSNPENSNPVFVSGNTLTSKQLKLTKSCIKHFE
jgi:hypothetical protein